MTVTEFLKTAVPFLSGISDEQAKSLATAATQLNCKRGHTILLKGVTVEGLHVVATGKVSVWIKPEKNKPGIGFNCG